jgi:hypothetical protein
MKTLFAVITFLALSAVILPQVCAAQEFDSYLSSKATGYEDFLREWHSTGLGAVSDILFTDATRQEIYRTIGAGDSTDWTGFYLVTQAQKYIITGDSLARDEVLRIAHYLHQVKDVTGDPGYLARFVAPDEAPWNVEFIGSDNKILGTGDYAGYFWVGRQVRDKYITWFWSLTWAYDAVDDETMRSVIREDFRDVVDTLVSNNWTIIDPFGQIYSAADIGADIRLSIILQAAHVTDDPEYWQMLDEEYEKDKNILWISSFSFFNKYFDYFAFINNHPFSEALFRLWPDRPRLEHIWKIWKTNIRSMVEGTHAAFFDVVYYESCLRLGGCDEQELADLIDDVTHGLNVMWDPPNYRRKVVCRDDLPIDSFSEWAHQVLTDYPWIGQLTGIEINVQTSVAHEVDDRCWESHLWERSPYHLECTGEEDQAETAPGLDYLISYWMGVYYGVLPGGGPYGDDELTDDDTAAADDTVTDDDTAADDTAATDDAADDSAASPVADDDDDDSNGCGC